MAETYAPAGTVSATTVSRFTAAEAATGTFGTMDRATITELLDRTRYLSQAGDLRYIGDTADANVTLGLTINQGGADDVILALKSSDIAHGITTDAETDTYATFKKVSATAGGVALRGYTETAVATQIEGAAVSEGATRTTAGTATIYLNAYLKSGTTVGAISADQNIVAFGNNSTTRFIFDSDGDFHADSSSTTF